jgi:hypothetical protein
MRQGKFGSLNPDAIEHLAEEVNRIATARRRRAPRFKLPHNVDAIAANKAIQA